MTLKQESTEQGEKMDEERKSLVKGCYVVLERLTPKNVQYHDLGVELDSNSPKPPFLIYYQLICQLNLGMRFEDIDFQPLLQVAENQDFQIDEITMIDKRTQNNRDMLQKLLYDLIFKNPEMYAKLIPKVFIDILYDTPADSENGEKVYLATVLKACRFRSRSGSNLLVRYPNVAEGNEERGVNLFIEIPKKRKLNTTTEKVSNTLKQI